jgi:hypothetical protein
MNFDKIPPKQVGYFGPRINFGTRINLRKIENSVTTLAALRRGLI